MRKNTTSYLVLLFVLVGGGVLAINDVRESMIYHSLRIWMNKPLEFKCYEVDIPKKWLFHSEKNRNENMLYTLKILNKKEGKYVFSSIMSDLDNKLEDDLKEKAQVLNRFNGGKYIGYKLGIDDQKGKVTYFVKLNDKPLFILSSKKEHVSDLLKSYTQSNQQDLIRYTCK